MKLLLLLLLASTCVANEDKPKFHFMECAQVASGFYEGCVGIVSNYYHEPREHITDKTDKLVYDIEGTCRGTQFSGVFSGDELNKYKGKCGQP